MDHFGRRAIARAWIALALPALLLCYAGQSALVLAQPAAIENPFFLLAPPAFLVPLVLLTTAATVIASQSIISGAFSVTQQAVQLGYLPRVRLIHTSESERGQVYAPKVNALILVAVIALVLAFRSSGALAAMFGFAVTATMVLTTLMIGFVIFRIWKGNPLWAVPLYLLLLALDVGLFAASATKFMAGAWLPAIVAALLFVVFSTWRTGRRLLVARLAGDAMPVETFLASTRNVTQVPATAIYLTSNPATIPPALLHNLKHNLVLHERVILLTVQTALVPRLADERRAEVTQLGEGMWRIVLRFGFAEQPNIPGTLERVADQVPGVDLGRAAYFLSRQTVIPTRAKRGMALWREALFSAMVRNSETPMSFFCLPPGRVVELGSQMEI